MNDSTMAAVSEKGRRILGRHTQEDLTEPQAYQRLKALRDSSQYDLNVSEGLSQLGAALRYEGATPTRQMRKQITELMRRVMGT